MQNFIGAIGLMLLSAAVYADSWSAHFAEPKAAQIMIADLACTKDCDAVVSVVATSKDKGQAPIQWTERVSLGTLDIAALLSNACVLDDGPRPSAFPQTRSKCSKDPAK